jgi:hypothetical protein
MMKEILRPHPPLGGNLDGTRDCGGDNLCEAEIYVKVGG